MPGLMRRRKVGQDRLLLVQKGGSLFHQACPGATSRFSTASLTSIQEAVKTVMPNTKSPDTRNTHAKDQEAEGTPINCEKWTEVAGCLEEEGVVEDKFSSLVTKDVSDTEDIEDGSLLEEDDRASTIQPAAEAAAENENAGLIASEASATMGASELSTPPSSPKSNSKFYFALVGRAFAWIGRAITRTSSQTAPTTLAGRTLSEPVRPTMGLPFQAFTEEATRTASDSAPTERDFDTLALLHR